VLAIDAWFALKLHAVQVFSALFCGWCVQRRRCSESFRLRTWFDA
jgi:hypothetical protein